MGPTQQKPREQKDAGAGAGAVQVMRVVQQESDFIFGTPGGSQWNGTKARASERLSRLFWLHSEGRQASAASSRTEGEPGQQLISVQDIVVRSGVESLYAQSNSRWIRPISSQAVPTNTRDRSLIVSHSVNQSISQSCHHQATSELTTQGYGIQSAKDLSHLRIVGLQALVQLESSSPRLSLSVISRLACSFNNSILQIELGGGESIAHIDCPFAFLSLPSPQAVASHSAPTVTIGLPSTITTSSSSSVTVTAAPRCITQGLGGIDPEARDLPGAQLTRPIYCRSLARSSERGRKKQGSQVARKKKEDKEEETRKTRRKKKKKKKQGRKNKEDKEEEEEEEEEEGQGRKKKKRRKEEV
ncbi:hypothetical protein MBM_06002 [Drepanopeziza brunnea f. sp. 'multigermtubi' MB_m1]|uniref:Uncharacterized protein n=1 Tax=Marssonina brunnea f. sp. multigermtubi (strain MB_m1) TaxID=1072389 RepID=K1WSF5_MARBU|nr:uncharacterized protein MBM_06002 [Drepanopeziza brunnea f. sp. 'multigermtubi' MB_m1]EKD15991.1 hypothetical protein MBM_06002 [Drepanopeziza brunnea f. sp. 'multigermtubi' MB_m1]